MDIPRADWPKQGVFIHPDMLPILKKRANDADVSVTIFIEQILVNFIWGDLPAKLRDRINCVIHETAEKRRSKAAA